MADEQQERKRARWRRNKRAERKRKALVPPELPKSLRRAVMFERNRRARNRHVTWRWRGASFFKDGSEEKALAFAADVWAAKTLIEWQLGSGNAKPTRIVRWLEDHEQTHGYAPSSLRIMVYRALDRIEIAERPVDYPNLEYLRWQTFDVSRWDHRK